jgi:hypothetical protein
VRGRRHRQRHDPGAPLSGFVDLLIAVGIGLTIGLLGRFAIRYLMSAPGSTDPDEVVEVAMDYRCGVCGLRLTVTRAPDEDITPPRHCHEPMEEAL